MLMPRATSPHGAVVLAFLHAPEWWPLLTAPPDGFDAAETAREVASSLSPREQGRLAGRVLMRWPRTDPATLRLVLPGMEPQ